MFMEECLQARDNGIKNTSENGVSTKVTSERSHRQRGDYMSELHKEREALIAQWRAEFDAENTAKSEGSILNELRRKRIQPCLDYLASLLSYLEVFVSNMPLTIGAIGLSWVTMGVVTFKFTEEMLPSCIPTHYRSAKCTFLEFPGCFSGVGCNDNSYFRVALAFHYLCHIVGGCCCLVFFVKACLAWRVVIDELADPTRSTPMGVVCITMVCIFAGRGIVGEIIVLLTSAFHVCLAFWFYYMTYKYRMLPDPSWFPNTVGLSYAAIKTWLYFPLIGKALMSLTLVFFFSTFFTSLIRVALNKRISAPVCWIQLSAPSITLYAFTLMQQPSAQREKEIEASAASMHEFVEHHRVWYLRFQHMMFMLSLVGMASALHSLFSRWDTFKTKPFSPAHAAFCFPTLSHANAIQVYRGAVNAFSSIAPRSFFKDALWMYWLTCLLVGATVNILFTYKFIARLPQWTKADVAGEEEPPEPEETIMHEFFDDSAARDRLSQPFVSPAVLQANEAGALVRVRRGTEDYLLHGAYVRSRHVASLGFDLTLNDEELREERARLLDWVARNAPRTRNRTHSQPLASSVFGVYGAVQTASHRRTNTDLDGMNALL